MSNELTTTQKTAIAVGNQGMRLNSFDEVWRFSVACATSGMAPKSYLKNPKSFEYSPEKIMIGVQAGMELGFTPFAALKSIAVINGTPALWGDALKALVERSPDCEYVKEWAEGEGEKMVAYCEAKRKGRPEPHRQSFSYADAKAAGLVGKDTYKAYQRRMLQMRARSWCLRDQFADFLCGLSAAEEVMDYPVETEPRLVSGEATPESSVEGLLGAMDADDAEVIDDDRNVIELIELGTKAEARKVYDEVCGPDSTYPQEVIDQASAAWTERCNREATQEADTLFT